MSLRLNGVQLIRSKGGKDTHWVNLPVEVAKEIKSLLDKLPKHHVTTEDQADSLDR